MKIDYIRIISKKRILLLKLRIFIKNYLYKSNIIFDIGKGVRIDKNVKFGVDNNSSISLGENIYIGPGCRIECSNEAKVSIKKNVILTGYDYLTSRSSLTIGSYSLIGEFVSIRDSDHNYEDIKQKIVEQGYKIDPIVIADDVWIGRGSIILKGVSIDKHSVIGANSVVNRNVPSFTLAAGQPIKIIKKYDNKVNKWYTL